MSDVAMIGDCGVCGNTLKCGENHAFTACKHLFCVPCLLKWHAHSRHSTCPLCRTLLYEPDPQEQEQEQEQEREAVLSVAHSQMDRVMTNHILRDIDFDVYESGMHEDMMEVIESHATQYCNESEMQCVFMGDVNLFVIPREEYNSRIEFGRTSPHIHYIMILSAMSDMANEFRCRFGRIEDVHIASTVPYVNWFAFRERISAINEEDGEHTTFWANEIMQVKMNEVMLLVQYVPRIRINV